MAGSRGSADTARDVRGFAVKFYTDEGIWDLVGNNIPVFFIQDGIKFPDFIHAAKPEPDREIPQAATAHDTFWDFVSLQPESTHMLMWAMSDRAIPRSYRTMEGFGVHTFRLYNEAGKTTLVKFHWKPAAGVHSLVWEEAQKLGGIDPDFHRRDLWDAIESGPEPSGTSGSRSSPTPRTRCSKGIDLLDPTKLVPEELAPVRLVGRMTLDRNPDNFFAETEQVAFCTAHVPRGIDFTDDPLLAARNFSYLDTQLTRLGGPNFDQLPINRPRAEVNTTQRDGFGQQAIHEGVAPYTPNSLGGGCPVLRRRRRCRLCPPGGRRHHRPGAGRLLRRPLQPGHPLLELDVGPRTRPHRGRLLLRAGQVRPSRESGSGWWPTWPRSTPSCAGGWRPTSGLTAPKGRPATGRRALARPVPDPDRPRSHRRPGGRRPGR